MKIKTNVKAGGMKIQHNQTLVAGTSHSAGLKVRTNVKAGGAHINHNQNRTRG